VKSQSLILFFLTSKDDSRVWVVHELITKRNMVKISNVLFCSSLAVYSLYSGFVIVGQYWAQNAPLKISNGYQMHTLCSDFIW
jgi:hypothetical protein